MVVGARINMKLRDMDRSIDISAGDFLIPYIGVEDQFIRFPRFVITEINRDEKTNQLSITGYDLIDDLKNHAIKELETNPPYTIGQFMTSLASFANTSYRVENVSNMYPFNLNYPLGANFEGTESIRDVLQAIAEATQTVIFVDQNNQIVLKRLSPTDTVKYTITKSDYIDLSSKTNRRLVGVAHITELGDNVEAKLEISGTTQQVHNNPFWELREDIGDIVDNALAVVGGLTINQFSCSWLGNLFLEIGDKIAIITKDNNTVESYFLDDVLTYDGSLQQKTQWNYSEEEGVFTNSSSIGDLLKQTYARVDKQEKKIELVASAANQNTTDISALYINTDAISASVAAQKTTYDAAMGSFSDQLQQIRNEVAATMTDTQIQIAIRQAIENSVNQVSTETGYVFDKDGLKISKSGSEISTVIDDDGMDISRSGTKVLVADSTGVNALNLTARQYLVIGTHSRFEDFGMRTGCFWLG